MLPDPRECLAGTGLMRILYQVDQVVGIVAAGVVIVLVGERAGLLLDVATFLVSATVLALTLRWRPASRDRSARTTLVGDFRAGWRLVFDNPSLRALVLLAWSAAVFLVAPEAVALAYARDDGAGPAVGAALMATLPAGAALGAWLVGRMDPLRQVRSIIVLAVAACLPLLPTSLAPPWQVVHAAVVPLRHGAGVHGAADDDGQPGHAAGDARPGQRAGRSRLLDRDGRDVPAVRGGGGPGHAGRRGHRGGGGRAGPGRGGAPGLAARRAAAHRGAGLPGRRLTPTRAT